jgi:hypothetical protein
MLNEGISKALVGRCNIWILWLGISLKGEEMVP